MKVAQWGILAAMVVVGFVGTCNEAAAGFLVVNAPKPKPVATKALSTAPAPEISTRLGVLEVGVRPTTIELRKGFVRDLPLKVALQQAIPSGWHSAIVVGDSRNTSWSTGRDGRPWVDVLREVAAKERLYSEVDWTKREVRVTDHVAPAEAKDVVLAKAKVLTPVTATPVIPKTLPQWQAKAGSTVRATVEDWGKRSGWMIVWPMNDLDYRVVAPLNFDGSIVDATGRLARLYEAAQRPLAVDIHLSQRVIVFSEKGVAKP